MITKERQLKISKLPFLGDNCYGPANLTGMGGRHGTNRLFFITALFDRPPRWPLNEMGELSRPSNQQWQELECFQELAREGDVSEPCREKCKS